eukprot:5957593-Alexandrium_andersonii.AAC.1
MHTSCDRSGALCLPRKGPREVSATVFRMSQQAGSHATGASVRRAAAKFTQPPAPSAVGRRAIEPTAVGGNVASLH